VDHDEREAAVAEFDDPGDRDLADRFFAYGWPILAPADGTVVDVHDRETDHVGRRTPDRIRSAVRVYPRRTVIRRSLDGLRRLRVVP
jgi:hypothetical protein